MDHHTVRRPLLRDLRGAGTIEKVFVVALFVFLAVLGVRRLGSDTKTSLDCQGEVIRRPDGTTGCANAPTGGGASIVASNTAPAQAAPTPPPVYKCTGRGCNCFVAGTPVLTAKGLRAIESIQPGELVLTRDESGGELEWKPVVQTFTNASRSLLAMRVLDGDGRSDLLFATGNHPFQVKDRGWVEAAALVPRRDLLVDVHGSPLALDEVKPLPVQTVVYNLEVAEHHTYFVGFLGIWVHNAGAKDLWKKVSTIRRRRPPAQPPAHTVGATVPVTWNDDYGNPVTQVEVTAVNGGGSYEVQWTDVNGNAQSGLLDNAGNLHPYPQIGNRVDIDLPDPILGFVIPNVPVLIVARNPDNTFSFEANVAGQRYSGTMAPNGANVQVTPPHVKPNYQFPQPIAGITPTWTPPGNRGRPGYVTLGPIRIQMPPPGNYGVYGTQVNNFVQATLEDLETIASTPSGQALIASLQANNRVVTINFVTGDSSSPDTEIHSTSIQPHIAIWDPINNLPGLGSASNVYYNPWLDGLPVNPTTSGQSDPLYIDKFQAGFGKAENWPSDVYLFHELLHTDDNGKGISLPPSDAYPPNYPNLGGSIGVSEERVTGLGDFVPAKLPPGAYTENTYRTERLLPLRNFYQGPNETWSDIRIRGFTPERLVTANTPAGVNPNSPPLPRNTVIEVAKLHLITAIDHNEVSQVLRHPRDGSGHTWIAIEFNNPADVPADWQQKFPDHYPFLTNPQRIMGHHVGFYPHHTVGASAFKSVRGSVEIEFGRDLDKITGIQTYNLTKAEVNDLLTWIDLGRGTKYNAYTKNCVSFATCAVEAAFKEPPGKTKLLGVNAPNALNEAIRQNTLKGDTAAKVAALTKVDGQVMPNQPLAALTSLPVLNPVARPPINGINGAYNPDGNVALNPLTQQQIYERRLKVDPNPPVLNTNIPAVENLVNMFKPLPALPPGACGT